jgi:hypothetical protein
VSYFDDNEDNTVYGRRRYKNRGASDRNEIVCKRCGEEGLYWYQMPSADGMSEHPVLFDGETGRRHVCKEVSADEFPST